MRSQRPFEQACCAHAYGCDFVVVQFDPPEATGSEPSPGPPMERAGDTLYLTIWGWRLRRFLDPALWFPRDQAAARWTKLEAAPARCFVCASNTMATPSIWSSSFRVWAKTLPLSRRPLATTRSS